jgi:hypothetical protein
VLSPELSEPLRVAQGGWIGERPFDLGRPSERVGEPVSKRQGRASARLLLLAELLAEALHAARGIHEALLASEERVALRADVRVNLRLGGSGLERIAAGALHRRRMVFGMDIGFHANLGARRNSCEIYSTTGVKDKPTMGWEFDSRPNAA